MNSLENILESVGRNIRKARRLKGIEKLQEAADLANIDKDYLGGIERGEHNFTMEKLVTIANAFDISVEELFIMNGDLLSLRFVISEHNVNTLKEVIKIICDLIDKKNKI